MRRPVDQLAGHLASALEQEADLGEVLTTLTAEGEATSLRKAADELRAGRPPEQALAGIAALPPAYQATLAANAPGPLREVAAADRLLRHYRTRMRSVAEVALGYFALLIITISIAVNAALPELARWGNLLSPERPGSWRYSAAILEIVFGPIGLGVIALLLVIAAWGCARARWSGRSGRLYSRAAACRSLHALLAIGLPLERALELATSLTKDRRLIRAAARAAALARDGRPVGEVLPLTQLVPKDLEPIWGLAEQPSTTDDADDRLVEVSDGLARAVEVEAEALAPTAGRGLWLAYTAIAGSLVLWLAVTLVLGWREVIAWPG